jgi:type IV pilus assembly protein PilO
MATPKLKAGIGGEGLSVVAKLIIGIVFVLLVAGAYFIVFFGEVSSQIELKTGELNEQQAKLNEAEAAKREYNKDLAEKARLEALARKQKKVLPDDAEMPSFLSTIQTVATTSGATLASWSPGEEAKEEFYAKVPMELKLEGKYHQIAKFFFGVGQVDRIINMENIVVRVKQSAAKERGFEDDKGAMVEVECLATAFRSLGKGEGGKKRRGGAAGGEGATPAPAPAPEAAPAGGGH